MPFSNGLNTHQELHKPPIVEDALDNIDGGEENLLPIAATQAPLRVEFEMWNISNPTPQTPEHLKLFWGGVQVSEKSWTAPVPPDDLYLMVAPGFMSEGVHSLHYEVTVYNGVTWPSEPFTLTVDKTAPLLDPIDERLVFPASVVQDGVTAYYLESHGDQLQAQVPDYDELKPGDVVTWYWDQSPFSYEKVDARTLISDDIGEPLFITFEGQMIRDRGDGPRYSYYQVTDRAGNRSRDARPVTIEARATPVPRDLPWPDIQEAVGTGERVTLEPEKAAQGAMVTVADTAVVYPDEVIWMQWGEPGQLGAYRTATPVVANTRRYAIPKEYVAPHVGKELPVSYEVVGPAQNFPSLIRKLRVNQLSTSRLPRVQCQGLSGGSLSLASIPANGAVLTQAAWILIATSQRVRIKVTAVATAGQPIELVVLDNHAVTSSELASGIGSTGNVRISKAFMTQVRIGSVFAVNVYVSFDEGRTWPPPQAPNFPILNLTLIA